MMLGTYDITLRRWEQVDEEQMLACIHDCLSINYEAGADMQPTAKNARVLWQMGLLAAERGEPCLAALRRAFPRDILGYTLWCELPNPLGMDFRCRVLHGLGTYVREPYRKIGLSNHLRTQAERDAGALGFGKVVGIAYHEPGLKSVLARSYRPVGTMVEKCL